jgi:hypothetical protein
MPSQQLKKERKDMSFGHAGVTSRSYSKLLGHESIKTMERNYSKWMKGRQDRLESLVSGTWEKWPGCLLLFPRFANRAVSEPMDQAFPPRPVLFLRLVFIPKPSRFRQLFSDLWVAYSDTEIPYVRCLGICWGKMKAIGSPPKTNDLHRSRACSKPECKAVCKGLSRC